VQALTLQPTEQRNGGVFLHNRGSGAAGYSALGGSHMHFAALSASDAGSYKALMLHGYEHAADAFTSTPEERAKEPDEWWVARLDNPGNLTVAFGAFDERDLVGTVAVEFSAKPKTRHKALVVAMYVLPQYRSKGVRVNCFDSQSNTACAAATSMCCNLRSLTGTVRRCDSMRASVSSPTASNQWPSSHQAASDPRCICGSTWRRDPQRGAVAGLRRQTAPPVQVRASFQPVPGQ
jgi:GNAT superfamily N-acetyltransferase